MILGTRTHVVIMLSAQDKISITLLEFFDLAIIIMSLICDRDFSELLCYKIH